MDPAADEVSRETAAVPATPLICGISPEELEREWNTMSATLASEMQGTICDTHENCDGSCSGKTTTTPPLMNQFANSFLAHALATDPQPSRATAQDTPRDRDWLDQQELPEHTYEPINSVAGDIRLLKVKRGLFRSDVVECELMTTSLDQDIPYQALSYCCGTAGRTEVMLCNGSKHCIYPSLNNALKAFRQSAYQGSYLWTDAVSINQDDKAELSKQIPMMRRIYAKAAGVFVYLGEADRQLSLGLDLMHRLVVIKQHGNGHKSPGATPNDVDTLDCIGPGRPCWIEYFKIFHSPWFCRTWILQEIALAKKATVAVGRYLTSWYTLDQSVQLLDDTRLPAIMLGRPGYLAIHTGWANYGAIQSIIQLMARPECTLAEVLFRTGGFEVSDARDKIVGVLGLVEDKTGELSALSDYRLSKAQVYHKATVYMIRMKADAPEWMIELVGLQRRIDFADVPSWVPDWQANKSNSNRISLLMAQRPFAGRSDFSSRWAGVGDGPYPSSLHVLGLCHHKIIHQSDAFVNEGEDEVMALRPWMKSAYACVQSSKELVYDDIEDAFARTLVVNNLCAHGSRNFAPIHDLLPTFRSAVLRLTQVAQAPLLTMDGLGNDPIQDYLASMILVRIFRRFAITDTGYMCLVPECSEIGDEVAVFLGFGTPFTIRPQSDFMVVEEGVEQVSAQLVGDTYMHGMMHGEAIRAAARSGSQPCLIDLI